MANYSDLKRKEQVLAYLKDRPGEWVDGTEIMNERVGGQRGGARVCELRKLGEPIESRRHPDPHRDIWQYRYLNEIPTSTSPRWRCTMCSTILPSSISPLPEPLAPLLSRTFCSTCRKTTVHRRLAG